MNIYKTGVVVAIVLAISTVGEYIWASQVHNSTVRVAGLSFEAVLNAGVIGYYFMHIYQVWRPGEEH